MHFSCLFEQNPLKHAIDEDNPAILNADVDKFEKSTNNENNINNNVLGDVTFLHAFITSLSVIVVSELGDKTFFIAAIMAMRHPRLIVFLGAISALALMTALSGEPLLIMPTLRINRNNFFSRCYKQLFLDNWPISYQESIRTGYLPHYLLFLD